MPDDRINEIDEKVNELVKKMKIELEKEKFNVDEQVLLNALKNSWDLLVDSNEARCPPGVW